MENIDINTGVNKEGWDTAMNKIGEECLFADDFNLCEKIRYLPTAIALYKNLRANIQRPSKMKKTVEKLAKHVEACLKFLKELPTEINIMINRTLEKCTSAGYESLQTKNPHWSIQILERDLDILRSILLFVKADIPKDNGGRSKNSILQYTIFQLAIIFKSGTKKALICKHCGWELDPLKQYSGNFYTFLLDIEPLLEKLDINLGTNETIGKIAVDIINQYKGLLDSIVS